MRKITDGGLVASEAARAAEGIAAVRVNEQEFITDAAIDSEAQESAADAMAGSEMADEARAGSMAGVTASVSGPQKGKGRALACWCGYI